MAHHAIVVTSWCKPHIDAVRQKAVDIFGEKFITDQIRSDINVYYTFSIGPDGSQEGWNGSIKGDNQRQEFQDWLTDSNLYVDAVTVRYGGDDPELAEVVKINTYEERNDE